jgi:hypothetical protein
MANYNNFQSTLGTTLNSFVNNPLGNSFFTQQLAQAQNNASNIGQRNMSNNLSNARTGGGLLGNSGSYLQGLTNRTQLSNSGLQSNAFNSTLQSAMNNRSTALAGMEAFNPLQTGSNTTQTQSQGLGSILGSVAGMGLNMAMPGLGSMLGGGSFSGGYGGGGNPYQSLYNAGQPSGLSPSSNPLSMGI